MHKHHFKIVTFSFWLQNRPVTMTVLMKYYRFNWIIGKLLAKCVWWFAPVCFCANKEIRSQLPYLNTSKANSNLKFKKNEILSRLCKFMCIFEFKKKLNSNWFQKRTRSDLGAADACPHSGLSFFIDWISQIQGAIHHPLMKLHGGTILFDQACPSLYCTRIHWVACC